MTKKLIAGLLVASLSIPLVPAPGMSWHGGPPPPRYHHNHHNDAWLWGLGGLVLGSAIVATVMQPPAQQVVYAEPPPPARYAYRPAYAPAQCRWERYVLDGYGRTAYDRYGQPLKEYTTGPCDYPPSW